MFIKKPLLAESLVISGAILILHLLALNLFLYWTVEWFDILMHFLGGLFIGIFSSYVLFGSGLFKIKSHAVILFIVVMASVLVVGLTWELWELFAGLSSVLRDQFDTVLDLVMDTLGGLVAFYYVKKKLWMIEN